MCCRASKEIGGRLHPAAIAMRPGAVLEGQDAVATRVSHKRSSSSSISDAAVPAVGIQVSERRGSSKCKQQQ
jgi:hypothetical protein